MEGLMMKLLEEKIVNDGVIKSGNVLKVDSFLNHQIDVPFVAELGKELKRLFADRNITKILTIEASGIGIACVAAMYFGVPVVFAKKSSGSNMDKDVYFTKIYSYTHSKTNDVVVSKRFLSKTDHVLIIDDFLANGCALEGLIDIVRQSGATVEGVGVAVEKGFQGGGDKLRKAGYNLHSLAIIDKMDAKTNTVVFRHEEA
jgi:xanthine phosphoribosyltransferase